MDGNWKYYNHAIVTATAPHVPPDTSWMKDRRKWKEYSEGSYALFARWSTDFDCEEPTQWWCVIKDTPFDLMSLKSKQRSMVSKGIKLVDVRAIVPADYAEPMADILIKAWRSYDASYSEGNDRARLTGEFSELRKDRLGNAEYLGAFLKETGQMIGYAIYHLYDDWVEYSVVKTDPEYLNTQVNAALVYYGLERYLKRDGVRYVIDGWRSLVHETNYQDYLEKYFGFRKAYCRLHIRYRWWVKALVYALYPFRSQIKKMSGNKLMYHLWCTLHQEEIHRSFRDR